MYGQILDLEIPQLLVERLRQGDFPVSVEVRACMKSRAECHHELWVVVVQLLRTLFSFLGALCLTPRGSDLISVRGRLEREMHAERNTSLVATALILGWDFSMSKRHFLFLGCDVGAATCGTSVFAGSECASRPHGLLH